MEIYENFYLKNLPGPHGLTLAMSRNFVDLDKAGRHDYFQWLFPLQEESSFNKLAPTLDEDLRTFLLSKKKVLENITLTAETYLNYLWYLRDCKKSWPSPTDHNNLRISRILRCLNLLNQTECADFIYKVLLREHKENKDLTINNMDHFRSAMFNKTFFVVTEDFSALRSFLKKFFPDHDLMRLDPSEVKDFTKLCEPVLNTIPPSNDEALDSDILLRGKQFNIGLKEHAKLEKYFHKFRFWY
jgi:hypothetical protein